MIVEREEREGREKERNELDKLDKASFQHDIAYEDFKDLGRRTTSNKALRVKAFSLVLLKFKI